MNANSTPTPAELAEQFPCTIRPFAVWYNDGAGCNSRKWNVNDESGNVVKDFADMDKALKVAAKMERESGWDAEARKQAQALANVIESTPAPDAELDKILSNFEQSEPIINIETLEKLDSIERSLEFSIRPRRLSLHILTLSGKELVEMAQDKNKVQVVAAARIFSESYIERLKNFVGILETANTRTALAMCFCENAEDVMREVDRSVGTDAQEEFEAHHA